jgi:hypothetical protein
MGMRCSTRDGRHRLPADKPFCEVCGLLVEYHSNSSVPKVTVSGKSISSGAVARDNKRRKIYERDKGYCQYCFKKISFEEATIDHILPKKKGGGNGKENLVISCFHCNQVKGDDITFGIALVLSLRHSIMKEVTKNDF